jgi:hypothetical protein
MGKLGSYFGARALLLVTLALTGCGGSSDSGLATPQSAGGSTSCPETGTQCSGDSIIRSENGIAVTSSGVQTYAISTNDLLQPNPSPGTAYGLQPATGGFADVRVKRDTTGQTTAVTLLLSKFGISWDGTTERPLIIETFGKNQGRVQLNSAGIATLQPLPPPTDINFYDYAIKGAAGTQANYANNIYFPRTEPVRCPSDYPNCPSVESTGVHVKAGDWRTGGTTPDTAWAARLHEDGATQAGYGVDANGNLVLLSSADGIGVSYPGFKGYRDYHQWSFGSANLSSWLTQDTVMINEWGGNYEHNKMRRGFVAFGEASAPTAMPTSGTARYAGSLRGWFSYDKNQDAHVIVGQVEATVNFSTRTIVLTFSGTRVDESSLDVVPVSLTSTLTLGSAEFANYFSGIASNSTMSGGASGRFYGAVGAGSSGTGPAEIAGVFQLQGAGTGPVAIGGVLLKRM